MFSPFQSPTHSNYLSMGNRSYRSSLIGSFSANFAFALFDCEESPKTRILGIHQEKAIKMTRCDRIDCDWEQFKEVYKVT